MFYSCRAWHPYKKMSALKDNAQVLTFIPTIYNSIGLGPAVSFFKAERDLWIQPIVCIWISYSGWKKCLNTQMTYSFIFKYMFCITLTRKSTHQNVKEKIKQTALRQWYQVKSLNSSDKIARISLKPDRINMFWLKNQQCGYLTDHFR